MILKGRSSEAKNHKGEYNMANWCQNKPPVKQLDFCTLFGYIFMETS